MLSESPPLHKKISLKLPPRLFFLVLVSILFGFILGYSTHSFTSEQLLCEKNAAPSAETATPTVTTTRPANRSTFPYKIEVFGHDYYEYMTIMVSTALGIPLSSGDQLFYKTTDGASPMFDTIANVNKHELFVLSPLKLDQFSVYGDERFLVEVQNVDYPLRNYLADRKFCRQDSDCVIRFHFDTCTNGAWNHYEPIIEGRGCQGWKNEGQAEGLGKQMGCEIEIPGYLDPVTERLDAEYESVKCIDNQCTAINPTFSCSLE